MYYVVILLYNIVVRGDCDTQMLKRMDSFMITVVYCHVLFYSVSSLCSWCSCCCHIFCSILVETLAEFFRSFLQFNELFCNINSRISHYISKEDRFCVGFSNDSLQSYVKEEWGSASTGIRPFLSRC